jgi:hypothetical protein
MIAETLQTFDQSPSRVFWLQPIKNVRSGVVVRFAAAVIICYGWGFAWPV